MSSSTSTTASSGSFPVVFLGASAYAYFDFKPEIADTTDRVVAALGTGLGTSVGTSLGMVLGGLGLAAVFGLAARSKGAAAIGGILGLLGGAFFGLTGGYSLSSDFMKDLMTDETAAQTENMEVSSYQRPGTSTPMTFNIG